MKVIKAESMGFCMGVRRAMQTVNNIIDNAPETSVHTFGPLIHNRLVLEDLKERGVSVIDDPEEAEGIIIIRAHGIKPEIKKILENKAFKVIDATCPRVLKSQQKVLKASEAGYRIVIAGDRNHGEVQGMAGYADSVDIIETAEQAEKIETDQNRNILLISQTTFGEADYKKICSVLKKKYPLTQITHSICPATEKRQEALKKLADSVDAVLVVGGKNSANTLRLYQTALKMGKEAWHIENADEIPETIRKYKVVGLTAGASTPDWIIKNVEDKLKSY